MKYNVSIQNPEGYENTPNQFIIQRWVTATLSNYLPHAELTIRFVSTKEIQSLNKLYRNKNKVTNVLSFTITPPDEVKKETPLLGDIVICNDVIQKEARAYNKTLEARFAHMIIHGMLHLLGFDHIDKKDAKIMEPIEIKLLAELGYSNPYEVSDP